MVEDPEAALLVHDQSEDRLVEGQALHLHPSGEEWPQLVAQLEGAGPEEIALERRGIGHRDAPEGQTRQERDLHLLQADLGPHLA